MMTDDIKVLAVILVLFIIIKMLKGLLNLASTIILIVVCVSLVIYIFPLSNVSRKVISSVTTYINYDKDDKFETGEIITSHTYNLSNFNKRSVLLDRYAKVILKRLHFGDTYQIPLRDAQVYFRSVEDGVEMIIMKM